MSGPPNAANGLGTSYANGASYPFTANVNLYAQWTNSGCTVQFQQPLDQSTTTSDVIVNKGKNGRVIPVKVVVTCGGVVQTDAQIAQGRLTIGVAVASEGGVTASDAVETYATAGQANTDGQFRYTGGSWIYNLDTTGVRIATNSFYRLDVYLNGVKISTATFAIFQPIK